jgi:peptide/nickel transport system substrate-binding protein
MSRRLTVRSGLAALAAVAGSVAVAACGNVATSGGSGGGGGGGSSQSSGKSGSDTSLTVVSGPTGPFVAGLSPFSTSDTPATLGMTSLVYEPLIMVNALNATQVKPWLASAYKWSDGGRKLTFTIPAGRTWSDGTPLTAADVAYTFDLIKKDPALNIRGVEFTGASAPSKTQAVLSFAAPAYTQLFNIGQVLIVPKHIWSKIGNPATYANDKPVGSGPYTLQSMSAEAMTFVKNPHYWQAGLPKVSTVRVTDYTSQNAALNALSAGQIDWSNLFISNPQEQWTSKNPTHNKLWLPPAGDWFLCPNTKMAPFNSAAVRRALALTIDRQKAVPEVEGKFYAPSTNPTGMLASDTQDLPSKYANQTLTYDAAQAKKEFLAAGMKPGSNGTLMQANGKPFKVSLLLPSAYTDWMSLGQLFVNEMKAAGIDASLDGVSSNAWTSDTVNGDYQLSFCGVWSSGGAYTTFNSLLNGSLTAPIGKPAVSNISRWNDPATNAALKAYRSTASSSAQAAAMQKVGTIVAQQAPIIPLMSVSAFGSYSTAHFTGWPGPGDAYQTDAIAVPFTEDVILHLRPAS